AGAARTAPHCADHLAARPLALPADPDAVLQDRGVRLALLALLGATPAGVGAGVALGIHQRALASDEGGGHRADRRAGHGQVVRTGVVVLVRAPLLELHQAVVRHLVADRRAGGTRVEAVHVRLVELAAVLKAGLLLGPCAPARRQEAGGPNSQRAQQFAT